MRVSRRVFIFTGLLSVLGLLYWKKIHIVANDIQLFFSNYESIIPEDDAVNTGNQISLFEEKLLSMLSSLGMVKTIIVVNKLINDEYQSGKVKLMNGWIVSETEFLVLALRKKYV